MAARRFRAIPRIRRISGGCARRAPRSARRCALDQRLLHPMIRQADGLLARVDWDMALDAVANGLRAIIERDGPDAIAFYLSGQLLTEDYYVANKLMKGFIGSANVDTNSRLCMASSVAGHQRAFGADTVPGIYQDLDEADLIVLVGSNAAWCHPVLYQRMIAAKRERGAEADRHRSAADRDGRGRRPVLADRARHGYRAVLRPARAPRRHAGARLRLHRPRTRRDLSKRWRAPAKSRRMRRRPPARPALDRGRRSALLRACRAKRNASSLAFRKASINRRRAPTRSTPSSTFISPPAVSAGPAWDRSRSPASPMPWADARSAGSPTSWPPIWASRPPRCDRVRRFWGAPRMATRRGPQGRRHVRGYRARDDQGAVGHGDQSGRVVAARRRDARGAEKARTVRRLRERSQQRHDRGWRTRAAAGRGVGREGRHGDQFGAAYLASARIPADAGRGAARLVDRQRGGAAPRLRPRLRLSRAGRYFSRACRVVRLREYGQRDFDIGALASLSDDGL